MNETEEVEEAMTASARRRKAVNSLAGAMKRSLENTNKSGLSSGDLAELRRIDAARPYSPALWKIIVGYHLDDGWGEGKWRDEREERWAAVLMGMAHTIGLHDYKLSFGSALAEAGWSETRFVRLMESRGKRLTEEIRRLALYFSSKSQPANWQEVADLVLDQDTGWAEDQRRHIARDYYRRLHSKESGTKANQGGTND